MTTMQLKNIKHVASMSEETFCYTASLYIDDRLIAEVSNRGTGGPDDVHPAGSTTRDQMEAEIERAIVALGLREKARADAEAFRKEHGLAEPAGAGTDYLERTFTILEGWCAEQVAEHLIARDVKREMRSKVLFQKPGDSAIYTTRFKGVRKIERKHIDHVRGKYPDATILNELPEKKALEILRAAS